METNYRKISGFADEIAEQISIQFSVLNKLGISYFEPRGVDGKNISMLNDDEVEALKKAMAEHNIKISSIGSPIGKIKLTDDFDAHFETFKRVVEIAKALDTKYIRIFSFYHDGGDTWTSEERADILAKLSKMLDYAKAEGVILLHENEKDIYGDTADRCLDIMKELYCDNFKAVFDPANFIQCNQDTKEAYAMLKDYIEYMHIKDARLSDGKVFPAGYGDGNVEFILKDLFDNGYDGFLSLEPHLGNFAGLAELENGDIMKDLPDSGEGTFTVAHNALKQILERI